MAWTRGVLDLTDEACTLTDVSCGMAFGSLGDCNTLREAAGVSFCSPTGRAKIVTGACRCSKLISFLIAPFGLFGVTGLRGSLAI